MKIGLYILIFLTIVSTVIISIKQPPMHSRIMIYDSQYTLVDENTSQVETKVESKELPSMPQENKLTQVEKSVQEETQTALTQTETVKDVKPVVKTQTGSTASVKPVVKTQTKPTVNVKTTTAPVKTVTKTTPKTVTTVQPNVVKKEVKPQQTVKTTAPKPITKVVTTQVPTKVKVLTQQEEEIAWNRWRSNLQNQIMRDTKLPIMPIGTVFKITFDVDRNGRVSNVQTWSTNPKYTPYAIEFIAPVIRSYQGKSILMFPAGSQRTATTFSGGWKISQSERYSTPGDYNDVEKVVR